MAWLKSGELPAGVLPTYVKRTPDRRFVGRCTRAGRRVEAGPCDTPQEAARLLAEALTALPPRPRRPKPPPREPTPAEAALLAAAAAVAAERGGRPVLWVTVTAPHHDRPDRTRTARVRPPAQP